MHKEITSRLNRIYDCDKAKRLWEKGIVKGKEISWKKQENIKEAIDEEYYISSIISTIGEPCGYCFAYRSCSICPIYRRRGTQCDCLNSYFKMFSSPTLHDLRKAHKSWCKSIGLDVYKDERKKKKK